MNVVKDSLKKGQVFLNNIQSKNLYIQIDLIQAKIFSSI